MTSICECKFYLVLDIAVARAERRMFEVSSKKQEARSRTGRVDFSASQALENGETGRLRSK
jgi:hypothetical protein